jgi:hypothetical protein
MLFAFLYQEASLQPLGIGKVDQYGRSCGKYLYSLHANFLQPLYLASALTNRHSPTCRVICLAWAASELWNWPSSLGS